MQIRLKDIVERLDCLMDEFHYYVNRETGEIVEIADEHYALIEEDDVLETMQKYQPWEQACIKEALDVYESNGKYVSLPTQYDIHEYRIMEEFCFGLDDDKIDLFLNAIRGRGAFRQFKNLIQHYHLNEDYYAFKYEKLYEIAKEWCEDQNLSYIDDFKKGQ